MQAGRLRYKQKGQAGRLRYNEKKIAGQEPAI